MSLWPYALVLDGDPIPLADVLASVTIHHGRETVTDEPTATTFQATFLDVDKAFVHAFDIGQSIALTVRNAGAPPDIPRFTGTISDARLDHPDLTVIAAGRLATLGAYEIGTANYPEERWSARVTRIFTEAGLAAYLVLEADSGFDPYLAARDAATAGPTNLRDYLAFIAPTVGALVADRMDGKIRVQALGARRLDAAVAIDPAAVAYAPSWVETWPAGNVVTVRYQADQGASVTASDSASVTRYGERPATIDTVIRDAADASFRATQALTRGAYSHWTMTEAPILHGLDLALGQPVILDELPPSAPFEPWTPIVEGWTDEIVAGDRAAPGTWTMTLSLSDPLISGVTIPWNAVPTTSAYHWSTIDQLTAWSQALTLDDLLAN